MRSFSTYAFAALAFGSALVNGHMVMEKPIPFGNPTNSPLDAGGSDFPCKGGSYDRSTVQNVMAVGSTQTLSFTGGATHGGGSCQVALTTDLNPTPSTKWMVIKSIEGGCPDSFDGNKDGSASFKGAAQFKYTIPEGIAPGEYVIAWTWLNKIGQREFYMNCGPATITGAEKKRYAPAGVSLARRQSSFPDLFVANIASVNDCVTKEGFDYNYPNAGDDVESAGHGPYMPLVCGAAGGSNPAPKPTGGNTPTKPSPTGSVPSGSVPSGGASTPGQSTPGQNTPGQNTPSQGNGKGNGQPQADSAGSPTVAPGNFATGAAPLPAEVSKASSSDSSAQAPAAGAGSSNSGAQAPAAEAPAAEAGSSNSGATPPAVAPAPSTGTSPVSAPVGTGSSSAPSGSSAGAQSGTCTEGDWLCVADGTSFQRCGSGRWSVPMQMPKGMTCTPGEGEFKQSPVTAAAASKFKRSPRRVAV